jgi:hypothetical protein
VVQKVDGEKIAPAANFRRPVRVTLITVFATLASLVSLLSALSLLFPKSFIGDFLSVKPEARDSFKRLGTAGIVGLLVLAVLFGYIAINMYRGRWLAYILLVAAIALNAVGDLITFIHHPSGSNAFPVIAAPCVVAFLLTRPFRDWAGRRRRSGPLHT